MNRTAVKRASGLETSDAERLRQDLDLLRHDVALLARNAGVSASRRARSNAAAARVGLGEAQHRTVALGRNLGGEITGRPLTVAAVASALGLLALVVWTWR